MKWLEVRNASKEDSGPVDILIYDQIGKDWWDGSGVQAKEFADELAKVSAGRKINVRINSPGGNVWDGLAIYHQLRARRDDVTCHVDGVAASIASIIAMSGRELVMPANALMMVHNPFGLAMGDAETMRKTADDLDKHKEVLVGIYAEKTGKTRDELSKMMDDETWMTGSDALASGFCDRCDAAVAMRNSFDLSRFRRVPAAVIGGTEPPPDGNNKKEGITMSDTNKTAPMAEVQTPPVAVIDPAEFAKVKAQLEAERTKRITNSLHVLAASRDIDVKEWLPRAIADESILDSIGKLPERGTQPVHPPIEVSDKEESEPSNNIEAGKAFMAIKDPRKRSQYFKAHKQKVLGSLDAPRNANSFTTLTHTVLSQQTIEAFTYTLLPLNAFSRNFSADAANEGDKVKVLFTTAADAPYDWAGSYVVQDADATGNDITLDKRKVVSWGLTTEEIMTQPLLSLNRFAIQKGNSLGLYVLQDIFSLVTKASYGSNAITTILSGGDFVAATATTFDMDEVSWLYSACGMANWPQTNRSMVLSVPYYATMFRESEVVGGDGAKDDMLQEAEIRRLMGFDIYETNGIATNATDNVTGFVAIPDGILIAMRAMLPEDGIALRPSTQVLTDAGSGATLVMREWFEASNDQSVRTLECFYGRRVGNAKGVKLIVSS